MSIRYKFAPLDFEQLQADLYSVTLSDSSVDRHGDTIDQSGWKLDTFKANPVLLWAHDASQLPIGKVLNIRVENGALRGEMKFADHDFAKDVKALIDGKFLRAVSVGFSPIKAEPAERESKNPFYPPLDFKEQELLELSVVPIPANPNALIDAKSAGIRTDMVAEWAEKALRAARGDGKWIKAEAFGAVVPAVEPLVIAPPAPKALEVTPEIIADWVRSAVDAAEKAERMARTGKID